MSKPIFRSIEAPDMDIDVDDVWACDVCADVTKDRDILRLYGGRCPGCDGYRIVHGYHDNGTPFCAELTGWEEK